MVVGVSDVNVSGFGVDGDAGCVSEVEFGHPPSGEVVSVFVK